MELFTTKKHISNNVKNKRLILHFPLIILIIMLVLFSNIPINADAASKLKMKSKLIIPVKAVYQLKVSGTGNKKIKWETSDKKVVYVSAKGKIKAKKEGKVVITAKVGNKSLKCKVTVKTLLIAHRGFSSEYPENTQYAFAAAFKKGFDGIECDVWESKNGDIMVHHDATTKRTTGKNRYIWKITKQNRTKFPIKYGNGIKKYKGKKLLIPTLQETAKIAAKYKGYMMLHIKLDYSDGYYLSDNGVKKIVRILRKYKVASRTMIFVSGSSTITRFKPYGIKLGVNISPETKNKFKYTVKWCRKNGIKTLVIGSVKAIRSYTAEKRVFNYTRKLKTELAVYNTKSKKVFRSLSENGAAFAMSDYYLKDDK